jgi:hypothetical protein
LDGAGSLCRARDAASEYIDDAKQCAGQPIYGFPGISPPKPRLIAETAQQAAHIAQSMAGELRRAPALVAIASTLPN